MDEMKLKLSSSLMRGLVSRLIAKVIYKQLGYRIDIQLNDIQIKVVDGKASVHADIDGEMQNEDFVKLVKTVDF